MSGLYVKLDVTYFSDDQIVELSPEAQLLYIRALCLCQTLETDGVFTAAQPRSTGARLGSARDPLRYLRELTVPTPRPQCADTVATPTSHLPYAREATCLTPVEQLDDRRYRITAWLKHNKPAAEIKRIRGERAKAGQKGGQASAEERAAQGKQTPSNLLDECEASSQASETETETETEATSESTTTTTPDLIPANNSRADDPRFDVVCRLFAKRATNKAVRINTTRERYEQGALKTIVAERGDEIRALLRDRPSASAETIVDLFERDNGYYGAVVPPAGTATLTQPPDKPRSNNSNSWARRDPEANRKKIDRIVDEITELGMFDGMPEPVRDAWVENPAPLPPELMARARHQEDEQIEEAVAS
jgi:hypothetical protein